MKRMLVGLCAASLGILLHAAPAAAGNIIWATLAGEACSQTQIDLYVKVHNPSYYNEWAATILRDSDVYDYFVSVDGDLYLTFMQAKDIMSSC